MSNDVFDLSGIDLSSEIFSSMSAEEKEAVLQILNDAKSGNTDIYSSILFEDYEEVPVDIDTFIEDNRYIGKTTRQGSTIYPYWRNVLRNIFDPKNHYTEIVFTGAIGLGKTTIAIIGMAYVLYRLLCLKNPQEFYKLQENSKIVLAFFNVNLELSGNVAFGKMQSMLKESPWFLEHGEIKGRKNEVFVPDKNIRFSIGSQAEHGLGQDIICLKGNTVIKTVNGDEKIEDLENKIIFVESDDGTLSTDCTVKQTGTTSELYKIELEDGTIIECTPNHRLKLKSGEYKQVKDLTENDELLNFTVNVQMNIG